MRAGVSGLESARIIGKRLWYVKYWAVRRASAGYGMRINGEHCLMMPQRSPRSSPQSAALIPGVGADISMAPRFCSSSAGSRRNCVVMAVATDERRNRRECGKCEIMRRGLPARDEDGIGIAHFIFIRITLRNSSETGASREWRLAGRQSWRNVRGLLPASMGICVASSAAYFCRGLGGVSTGATRGDEAALK